MIEDTEKQTESVENNQQAQQVTPPDEKTLRDALASGDEYDLPEMPEETEKSDEDDTVPEGDETSDPQDKPDEAGEEKPDTSTDEKDDTELPPLKEGEGATDTGGELKTKPIWDKVKSDYETQFGEGTFKMPEGITGENEYDAMLDYLSKTLEPDISGLPEEAQEIIALHKEGKYDPEKYFSQKTLESSDVTKLPDKDLLFNLYKSRDGKSETNPDGFTDEEINEHLEKRTKIELRDMAQSARQSISKSRDEKQKQKASQQQEQYTKAVEQAEKVRKERAAKVVNQFKSRSNIFGIDFSPEEKQKFDKEFFDMVALNKETGTTKIAEMLNDDSVLYSVAAILWKGDLSGYITDVKESVKKNVEKKLDRTLDTEKGSTKTAKLVDRQKLV